MNQLEQTNKLLNDKLHRYRNEPLIVETARSVASQIMTSVREFKRNKLVPKLDLSRVEIDEADFESEDENIERMIEEAIEHELRENPNIEHQFDSIEEFKKYIIQKYFSNDNDDDNNSNHSELNKAY